MIFDYQYILWVLIPGMIISGGASLLVRSAFNRYSKVGTRRGFTGAQAAKVLLDNAGIHDVDIVATQGHLSDHYNPQSKQLALSEDVFASTSVAAVGIACHEAGHAIQHAERYGPLGLRSALVPLAGVGSNIGYLVMVVGLFMLKPGIVGIGAILFSAVLFFQLVTLPVEFDATARAKRLVLEAGIIDSDERIGMDRTLNAAALTYVAAVISTLLTLLYYLVRSGLLGGRDD